MKVIETEVFTLDELDDKAKDKAREWYRDTLSDDSFWYECVIDDAKRMFALCGWEIKNIRWSGFSSQGDGACFEGRWSAHYVIAGGVIKEALREVELNRIATGFEKLAREFPDASFTVKHRGHYNHENCTEFDFHIAEEQDIVGLESGTTQSTAEVDLEELAKDAMKWTYRQLEKEWCWYYSNEQVDESIEANEYTFTKDGRRF